MKLIAILLAASIVFTSCSPGPRRQLNEQERVADMLWLYTKFELNYAPLKYKEKLHNFDYDALKASFLTEAKKEQTNIEFYHLMHKFVASFKDAHTASSIMPSNLPNRLDVYYLGFIGQRKKDSFIVEELLPTIDADSNYPIKIGDEITAFNGKPLFEVIDTKLAPLRHLGNAQANYTFHMNNIFNRNTLAMPAPGKDFADLTIKRSDTRNEIISLPWVKRDYSVYAKEQAEAKKAKEAASFDIEEMMEMTKLFSLGSAAKYMSLSHIKNIILSSESREEVLTKAFAYANTSSPYSSFEIQDDNLLAQTLNFIDLVAEKDKKTEETPTLLEKLQKTRYTPENAFYLEHAKVYPAYIAAHSSKEGVISYSGYIKLDTFSPSGAEKDVLSEFKKTLKIFQNFGIKNIIIDMINNGGGSLSLGQKLAQLLSHETISFPALEVKLNESWMDSFESASLAAKSDAEKEIASRVFQTLVKNQENGKWLSERFSGEKLFPYQLRKPNNNLVISDTENYKFNVAVLVNEMCASMCDIFSGMIKDNNLGKIVGTQTMGAGGNVVNHMSAPNSGLIVRLTESLIVRTNSEYIENKGIMPDVEINVNEYASSKYQEVIQKALESL